jgi:carbon storage regulator
MLVLTRKEGEQIRIGAEIEVTVLAIHKGRVRLGFAGPPQVSIHRQEVFQRIEANRREAVAGPPVLAQEVA